MTAYYLTDGGKLHVLNRVKRYQATNKGKNTIAAYRARPETKAARNIRTIRYGHKYPLRRTARDKVYYAVKSGKLKRGVCEVCGDIEVHAHHDDYTKPLEVRWLCRKHHEDIHHLGVYHEM